MMLSASGNGVSAPTSFTKLLLEWMPRRWHFHLAARPVRWGLTAPTQGEAVAAGACKPESLLRILSLAIDGEEIAPSTLVHNCGE